jgi:hypothetical protein
MSSNESLFARQTEQSSTLEELGFDYTTLSPKIRVVVQQHANEIKSLMRRTAQDVINIGQKLLDVKEQLGHGHFEAWLRAEFNWGQWTARKFMQVTRQFKSVNFTDLSIEASALYLLAAPSTHEAVRQEALERAGQGEAITHAKVKAMVSQYGESANSEASKSITINIPAETAGWEASTLAQPLPVAQTMDAQRARGVEKSEDKLPGKKTETPAQASICSHDMAPAADSGNYPPKADSGDYPPKDLAEIEIQSLFGVGHFVCITDFGQQDHKWLGEVAEVKEATATEIEVVIKISLQLPPIEE